MTKTKNKTEVLGPFYLIEHPKEWASETGWSLKMRALTVSVLITAIIGFCATGFMFSLGTPFSIDWMKTGMIVTAIFTVMHSFNGHGFDDRGSLWSMIFGLVLSTLLFTGILFYGGVIHMSENISDRAWVIANIIFLLWITDYLFILRIRKVNG